MFLYYFVNLHSCVDKKIIVDVSCKCPVHLSLFCSVLHAGLYPTRSLSGVKCLPDIADRLRLCLFCNFLLIFVPLLWLTWLCSEMVSLYVLSVFIVNISNYVMLWNASLHGAFYLENLPDALCCSCVWLTVWPDVLRAALCSRCLLL